MLAVHRDGNYIVLHDPRSRARIPVVVDPRSGEIAVSMPTVNQLAEDYVEYFTVGDLKRAVRDHDRLIDRGLRFSRHYSEMLTGDPRYAGKDLRTLRTAIEQHYLQFRPQVDRIIGNVGDMGDLHLAVDAETYAAV